MGGSFAIFQSWNPETRGFCELSSVPKEQCGVDLPARGLSNDRKSLKQNWLIEASAKQTLSSTPCPLHHFETPFRTTQQLHADERQIHLPFQQVLSTPLYLHFQVQLVPYCQKSTEPESRSSRDTALHSAIDPRVLQVRMCNREWRYLLVWILESLAPILYRVQ